MTAAMRCTRTCICRAFSASLTHSLLLLCHTMRYPLDGQKQATFGGGMCLYSPTVVELRGNRITHNTALKLGGGMECARFYGTQTSFVSSANVWAENTAALRGGGIITHPCDVNVHGDVFLGNTAGVEGGGVMAYGGTAVALTHAVLACNTAPAGGGAAVRLSDSGDASALSLACSSVLANGGGSGDTGAERCLRVLAEGGLPVAAAGAAAGAASSSRAVGGPLSPDVLLAAVAAAASGSQATAAAGVNASTAAHDAAERGGGLYVGPRQSASLHASSVAGNVATSSGGGVYLDRGASVTVTGGLPPPEGPEGRQSGVGSSSDSGGEGAELLPLLPLDVVTGAAAAAPGASLLSHNGCPGGSGGGAFLDDSARLSMSNSLLSHNTVREVGELWYWPMPMHDDVYDTALPHSQ